MSSAMRQAASVQKSFAIAASRRISVWCASTIAEVNHVTLSIVKVVAAIMEILAAIASCFPTTWPHWFRLLHQSRAINNDFLAIAVQAAGTVRRPVFNVINASFKPCPRPQIIFSFGTLTSVNFIKPF